MEITVTSRHASITNAMRLYAEEKVRHITRIFDRLTSARIVLEMRGDQAFAEANVHAPRGATLVAHATAPTIFGAVDELESRLEHQLRKLKTRVEERRHAGGPAAPVLEG